MTAAFNPTVNPSETSSPAPKINRRSALRQMGSLAGAALLTRAAASAPRAYAAQAAPAAAPSGPFTLPALPYAYDALEPYFDAETMHLHHDKHHQSYVDKLNAAVVGHPELASLSVYDLMTRIDSLPQPLMNAIRNQGGGHANHSFWWPSLGKGGSRPTGELAKAISAKFGSVDSMQEKLTAAAVGVFGSGWAWVVNRPGVGLDIVTTPNQDSPLTVGLTPVLGIDVWEHAYYLKYKNKRPDYVKAYFSVINWDGVSAKFAQKA
jgi:Fe-Mn family superoxide dismutase